MEQLQLKLHQRNIEVFKNDLLNSTNEYLSAIIDDKIKDKIQYSDFVLPVNKNDDYIVGKIEFSNKGAFIKNPTYCFVSVKTCFTMNNHNEIDVKCVLSLAGKKKPLSYTAPIIYYPLIEMELTREQVEGLDANALDHYVRTLLIKAGINAPIKIKEKKETKLWWEV